MSRQHTLRAGSAVAAFDLADGARLTQLRLGDKDLLVSHTGQEEMWWGAFVMAPWTSLLRDFAPVGGSRTKRSIVARGSDAAWHGVARHGTWVLEPDGSFAVPLYGGWPFGGKARMRAALMQNRLEVDLTVVAEDSRMPAAVGWHPWFVRSLDGVDVQVVVPEGAEVQERDSTDSPTGQWVAPTRRWNDCLKSPGPILLTYPGVGTLAISFSGEYVTLFTEHPQGVCVEPVSSPAGKMDHVLGPGDSLTLRVSVEWVGASPAEPASLRG